MVKCYIHKVISVIRILAVPFTRESMTIINSDKLVTCMEELQWLDEGDFKVTKFSSSYM